MTQNLTGAPDGAEAWRDRDTGAAYLVYTIPGTNPPVAMRWWIPDNDAVEGLWGKGVAPTIDREMSHDEFLKTGAVDMGNSRELQPMHHPFDVIMDQYNRMAAVKPWLHDPEILAINMAARLEGRDVLPDELHNTNWWKTHSDPERKWMELSSSDPATAQRLMTDNRNSTIGLLEQAGIYNVPRQLAEFMSDKMTSGAWTQDYLKTQATLLSDPAAIGRLDSSLTDLMQQHPEYGKLDTTQKGRQQVDQLINQWMGPAFSKGWTDQQRDYWAGRFRHDPDAQLEFTNVLKKQRLAMFPQYQNENLSYEDIAAPWRSFVSQQWGQQPDETDPLFAKIVATNDADTNAKLLRDEGLKRGVGKVVEDATADFTKSLGGTLRPSLY